MDLPLRSQPYTTSNDHPMVIRSKCGVLKPKAYFTMMLPKPDLVKEILLILEMEAAMYCEYDTLLKNKTWELVPLP